MKYTTYDDKEYEIVIHKDQYYLISETQDQGFSPLIDRNGKKHDNRFIQLVEKNDLKIICSYKFKAVLNQVHYLISRVDSNGHLVLTSKDPRSVTENNFVKKEQFVFEKIVKINDVTKLIKLGKPIKGFQGVVTEEEVSYTELKKYF